MKPPIIVTGATGQVGLFTISCLLEQGRDVIAVTRDKAAEPAVKMPGLQPVPWSRLAETLAGLEGRGREKAALVSCGPARLASELVQMETTAGGGQWERVLVISTTSTMTKAMSVHRAERDTIAGIEAALASVRKVCSAGRVPLTILSPTLIYGCGMDQNVSRVFRWIRRFGFAPVAWSAQGLRQPLHVADLAATIASAMQQEPAPALETPVCGRGAIAYQEMTGRLFDAAGRKRRLLRLPGPLAPVAVGLARLMPGMQGLNSEMFRRQRVDMVFDDSVARRHLGHDPREFRPREEDFRIPGRIRQVQQAITATDDREVKAGKRV